MSGSRKLFRNKFHAAGPTTAKARRPHASSRNRATTSTWRLAEDAAAHQPERPAHIRRPAMPMQAPAHRHPKPAPHATRSATSSQSSSPVAIIGLLGANAAQSEAGVSTFKPRSHSPPAPPTTRAAASTTRCNPSATDPGAPVNSRPQQSTQDATKARTSMAADPPSSDRRTRRSRRSQQKDAEPTTDTWRSRPRPAETITPSNRTRPQAVTAPAPSRTDGP